MGRWADYRAWRKRREELVTEAQDMALAREARRVREAFTSAEGSEPAVEVRWVLAEDGASDARKPPHRLREEAPLGIPEGNSD